MSIRNVNFNESKCQTNFPTSYSQPSFQVQGFSVVRQTVHLPRQTRMSPVAPPYSSSEVPLPMMARVLLGGQSVAHRNTTEPPEGGFHRTHKHKTLSYNSPSVCTARFHKSVDTFVTQEDINQKIQFSVRGFYQVIQ